MVAAGVLLSGVQNLAIDIAHEKGDGRLRRWGGTPMSPFVYFAGKIGQVVVTATTQTVLLLVVARFALGIALPSTAESGSRSGGSGLSGLAASSLLGIALSSVPRSGKSASAVVLPITLVLQFISGVYLQFYGLPTWMQNLASAFPLKWMAQGMRAGLPARGLPAARGRKRLESRGVAGALGIWLVVGLVLTRLTFRWIRRDA